VAACQAAVPAPVARPARGPGIQALS
jgi:hypothetical protein